MFSIRVGALLYVGSNPHESTKHKESMNLTRPGTCWMQNRERVFIFSYRIPQWGYSDQLSGCFLLPRFIVGKVLPFLHTRLFNTLAITCTLLTIFTKRLFTQKFHLGQGYSPWSDVEGYFCVCVCSVWFIAGETLEACYVIDESFDFIVTSWLFKRFSVWKINTLNLEVRLLCYLIYIGMFAYSLILCEDCWNNFVAYLLVGIEFLALFLLFEFLLHCCFS